MSVRRVAVVTNTAPPGPVGGIGAAHYNLHRALIAAGLESRLFVYGPVEAHPEGEYERGLPPMAWRLVRKSVYTASRAANGGKPLAAFADYAANAVSGLALWRRIAQYAPDVALVPDHGAPSALVPRSGCGRVVFISHHSTLRFAGGGLSAYCDKDLRLAGRLEQRAVDRALGVVCPSGYMRDVFLGAYRAHCPVEVIPNVVDTRSLEEIPCSSMPDEHGLARDVHIVHIPSAGNHLKGSEFVPEIVAELAQRAGGRLAFYLSGAIGQELREQLSAACGDATIIAPGALSYTANIGNVKRCHVCVSPCLTESFGMAQLEAQLCGLPVVAFDAGGNRDVLVEGRSGYLVACRDTRALVEKAAGLLTDTGLRDRMGLDARRLALERFSPERVVGQYLRFIDCL